MRVSANEKKDAQVQAALELLDELFADYKPLDFSVRFWDGTTWGLPESQHPDFTLVIKHPGTLRRMFLKGDQLSLGEAFIYDDFDVEGNMEASFKVADHLNRQSLRVIDRLKLGRKIMGLPRGVRDDDKYSQARLKGRAHSRKRDAEAVTYHYNVESEFFRLWLDRQMCYSCAYFQSPDESLDEAQANKLEYTCRKLRLKPGERLLDIGCGWGSMILHAVRNFGVTALGITLSAPQAEWANRVIREAGLEKKARVEVADYRGINDPEGFDKVVSVGMVEHVGLKSLGDYFKRANALLKPRGMFLNHGISKQYGYEVYTGPSFVDRYVFPDGELVPIAATLRSAERWGFEVRDVESLREHYRLTLQHWVRRLEKAHKEAVLLTNETTYRIWRLFMAGFAHQFDKGLLNVHQTLLSKPENGTSGLPLTRSDWYS